MLLKQMAAVTPAGGGQQQTCHVTLGTLSFASMLSCKKLGCCGVVLMLFIVIDVVTT